jgi:hypothetical protein
MMQRETWLALRAFNGSLVRGTPDDASQRVERLFPPEPEWFTVECVYNDTSATIYYVDGDLTRPEVDDMINRVLVSRLKVAHPNQ